MNTPLGASRLRVHALSCGVLMLPIFLWNVLLGPFLPPILQTEEFWRDIPPLVTYGENAFRLFIDILPFFMPLELLTGVQRRGLILFSVGLVAYILAWLALILFPQSQWSLSWVGVLAPAYTPLVWLTGLGLLGRRLYWTCSYRWWMYLWLAAGFTVFHVTHVGIVYIRNA